ncbi:Chromobox -like protein 2, partial [Trichinella pseudospiralis]
LVHCRLIRGVQWLKITFTTGNSTNKNHGFERLEVINIGKLNIFRLLICNRTDNADENSVFRLKTRMTGESDVFMAEFILKQRYRKGKKEYLVRWQGFTEEHDTWEPENHILGQQLLEQFKTAKKKGFKNAYEYNQFKEMMVSRTSAKESKNVLTASNASSVQSDKKKVGRKKRSFNIKQGEPSCVSVDTKENQEGESKKDAPAAKPPLSDFFQKLLSLRTPPLVSTSTCTYHNGQITMEDFEVKVKKFLDLLRAETCRKRS